MKSPNRVAPLRWLGQSILAAAITTCTIALSPTVANAQDEPNWSAAGGFEFDTAPRRTHFGFYTRFTGTSEEFGSIGSGSGDLDWWVGDLVAAIEAEIPTVPLSIYADVTYRFIASGDNASTGWSDLGLGVKAEVFKEDAFLLSAYLLGSIPIGPDRVNLLDFKAANLGVAMSLMPTSFFALNTNIALGSLWDLEWPDGNSTHSFEVSFLVETVLILPVVELASVRLGLRGSYRENAWDKDAFYLYAQGNVLFAFLRVGVPLEVDGGLDGVQQGFDTGDITIYLGIDLEF